MAPQARTLESFLKASLARGAIAPAAAMARHLAGRFNGEVRAVLFYGSCLRTGKVDGLVMDFYVLVGDYRRAYGKRWLVLANRVLPPNVFFIETASGKAKLRAKVAVLSIGDFLERCRGERFNVSVWARFSQPSRLVWCKDSATRETVVKGVRRACLAMAGEALPMLRAKRDAKTLWTGALRLTYGAELRAEREGKAAELFRLDKAYYEAITPLVLRELAGRPPVSARAARRKWRLRKINGKAASLLRLVKGVFTFRGGIDYLAWKIERASGVAVELKPWQRRFPILAGLVLFFRLRRKGAFR